MKATKISYSRVFSLPDFQNEKISIELELEETDLAGDAIKKARRFCEIHAMNSTTDVEEKRFQEIMKNPDNYKVGEYKEAEAFFKRKNDIDDLPF